MDHPPSVFSLRKIWRRALDYLGRPANSPDRRARPGEYGPHSHCPPPWKAVAVGIAGLVGLLWLAVSLIPWSVPTDSRPANATLRSVRSPVAAVPTIPVAVANRGTSRLLPPAGAFTAAPAISGNRRRFLADTTVRPSRGPSLPEVPATVASAGAPPALLRDSPAVPTQRSWNLELIARQADTHTQRGFELASRRAFYAARLEFVRGLRLIAQGLDSEYRTSRHSQALRAGLVSVEEAADFVPHGSCLEAELDLAAIVEGHRTPVLKGQPLEGLTPMHAVQLYFTFAQEQLAAGGGSEVAAAMALHALGKLHTAVADGQATTIRVSRPKAMAFFQAALLVMPNHYMAANDLAVLLAGNSRYEDARGVLQHSLSVRPTGAAWQNLAVVLTRLGRSAQAEAAYRAAAQMGRTPPRDRQPKSDHPVRWLDPAAFARTPRPSHTSKVSPVRSDCIHAVFPGIQSAGPDESGHYEQVRLILTCQALGPAAPNNIRGVDCASCGWCQRKGWEAMRAINWQAYAQGEYVGHERTPHVPEYRLRVDDRLDMVYRRTREERAEPYRLSVGDELRVESLTDQTLDRELIIQPDGTITVRLLGQVHATNRTVAQLRGLLEKEYHKYYKVPAITVTPLKVNSKLEDLLASVDRRYGMGGQSQPVTVTPEGTISLPAVGSVYVQALTLGELRVELNERYREQINGIEVIPSLIQRAPRYAYVMGEVAQPGRFELTGPTTLLQAIAMAGSWNNGAHLKQVVVFRRGDDWRLTATVVDLHAALHGKQPCPAGEIWLSDSDVVIVPKTPILAAGDFIELVFTRGIYGVFPLDASINFAKLSTL